MSGLNLAFLGSPKIELDGRLVETDRRKAVALLAYLAVTGKPYGRDHLAALLWPDYERSSAYAYLRRTLWEIKDMLGEGWVQSDRETASFKGGGKYHLDTDEFLRLSSTSPDGTRAALEKAVLLYRGDFLSGFVVQDTAPFEDWQEQQAQYFCRELAAALERLVELLGQDKAYEDGLLHARRWLALDELNEAAHRALMRLYAGLGDRSAVVRQYEACSRVLKDELRLAPQTETTALYESLLRGEAEGKTDQPGKPTSRQVKPVSHLPTSLTPFVGRRPEVEKLKDLILDPDHRLLTLTGPGGAGKTRLSIQSASEVAEAFPDGVWFVSLAPLETGEALVPALAKALDFSFYREEELPREQLLDYLCDKRMLLILDNFEHLIEHGVELVGEILSTTQHLKLLVTSRERLNLLSEQLYRVSGMRFPDLSETVAWTDPEQQAGAFSAMLLFVERARRVQPGFRLTPDNTAAVIQICRLVDGMPLGIELASAWVEMLSPGEIADEIRRSIDFLQTTLQDVSERQRSLRAVFESSWKLLSAGQQRVFQQLTVFPGSFSRDAAEKVGGVDLRMLLDLVNKSWLQPVSQDRYQLHDILRKFGQERLKQDSAAWQAARDSHAAYFMDFVKAQETALRGPGQLDALDAMDIEIENNLQDAWDWLVERRRFSVLVEQALPALFHFGMIRIQDERLRAMTRRARLALQSSRARPEQVLAAILGTVEAYFEANWMVIGEETRARLIKLWDIVTASSMADEMDFWYVVLLAAYQSEIGFENSPPGFDDLLRKIRAKDEPWMTGYLLLAAYALPGLVLEEKEHYLEEAIRIFQNLGVVAELGVALRFRGQLAWNKNDYDEAIRYDTAALEYMEKAGDTLGLGLIWYDLGDVHLDRGDMEEAFQAYHEQRRIYEKTGNQRLVGIALSWESLAASRYSTPEHAMETRRESLEIFQRGKNMNDVAWGCWETGELFRLAGDFEQAVVWYDKALPQFEQIRDLNGQAYYQRGLGDIALVHEQWERAQRCFQAALNILEEEHRPTKSWTYTYVQARLGCALVGLGDLQTAWQTFLRSIDGAKDNIYTGLLQVSLAGMAAWYVAAGQPEKGLELAAHVESDPLSWHETRKQAAVVIALARKVLPEEAVQAAQTRGRALAAGQALALALGEAG
jgi:predicted ATPase/DNA-binding SARP family transcriptional activator